MKAPKSLGFANNASVFERKGDPWTTDAEGITDYGRIKTALVPLYSREDLRMRKRQAVVLNRMHHALGIKAKSVSYSETVSYLDEDPDIDMYTKASVAPDRERIGKLAKATKATVAKSDEAVMADRERDILRRALFGRK